MSADGVFNEIVHAPLRLRICGLLRSVDELDFALVRDTLGVSDATLSKHLKALINAGLASSTKTASALRGDSRRITWLRLTASGRSAFDDHLRALRKIAGGYDIPPIPSSHGQGHMVRSPANNEPAASFPRRLPFGSRDTRPTPNAS